MMRESRLKRMLVSAHYSAREKFTKIVPASLKITPDFMIVGAQKAGTTAMFDYLISHPQVMEPWFKEMDFFNRRRMFANKNSYELDDYRTLFSRKSTKEGLERKLAKSVITGEASQYMSFKDTPRRIRDMLPETKIIILLRDPVKRAYSHYCMRKRYGWEKESFSEAFYREKVSDEMSGSSSYKYRGLYALHLSWWFESFPKEQLLILESTDVRENKNNVYDSVCGFLGIESFYPDESIESNVGDYEKPDDASLKLWADFYRPHNQELYTVLNRDFGWLS